MELTMEEYAKIYDEAYNSEIPKDSHVRRDDEGYRKALFEKMVSDKIEEKRRKRRMA